jgi:photosynthetic reaction center H subunit
VPRRCADFQGERTQGADGTPIDPVGNPLLAGVGPGAWAERADHPDLDHHGQAEDPAAVRGAASCGVSERDPDPRGMKLVDANGEEVGTVRDLWLDVPEMVFRYLEVEPGRRLRAARSCP